MANRKCGLICVGLLMLLSGCVERQLRVTSTPPGAKVYVNNQPIGYTPCDMPFTYYGTYQITLELDGHQTRIENERIRPPWYSFPPIDFVAENIYPFKASDIQRLHYDMSPLPHVSLDELRAQAEELRGRGKGLPEPTVPSGPGNGRTPPPAGGNALPPTDPLPINGGQLQPPTQEPLP